ncbi:conserved hypothetical protein [Desulforamulus reducens MI-1]|uniref:GerMN domain-containing protein n=1 Tax=Desulforamulus reducens (strain ATCC BAA-1160 / DSM 100696 / MI-1) TaxID=349161 RepID=A4J837_DESRM|nr:GerMN domain-containing protein [Desulforamulus reducens]ABO51240.1 conserved hypothetical protein [Desulforamulus reducens MI-1]
MKKYALLFIIILSFLFTGCNGNVNTKEQQPKAAAKETVKATLYFANEQADALLPVEREISKSSDMVVSLVNELNNPGKYAPILPNGTKLIDYKTQGDTLTLNFNKDFANLQGTTGETLAINALVNTLTELPQYKKVRLLVEGKPLETGHAIYDQPLERNESIIQK